MLNPIVTVLDALPTFDSLRNFLSQLGVAGKSKASSWVPTAEFLTQADVESAYVSDWLSRRIVDIVPYHATREWRTWQADQAEQLYDVEKRFKVRAKYRRAMVYDRLYGGGAILIGAQTDLPEEPLDVSKIGKGDLKYLHVFHRYQLVEGDVITDIESEDYGKPAWYSLVGGEAINAVKIHRSRFAFFISMEQPSGLTSTSGVSSLAWGQSVYDFVLRACVRAEAAAENGAALMEEAKVDVIKVDNLPAQLSTKEGVNRLVARFTLANQLKSSNSMLLLGGSETFDRKQVSFAGIPEMIQQNFQIAAGAARVPIVVILGQSPAGLNATGESDIRNFYDEVKVYQTTDLQETLAPVDEALIRTTLGDAREGVAYEWNPLWQLSETEKADIGGKKITAVKTLGETGLFAPEELRPAVADVLISDGFLPTLDQHMLDEAEMARLAEEEAARQEVAVEAQARAALELARGGSNAPGGSEADPNASPGERTTDAAPRTLYLRRDVVNSKEILGFYRVQGVPGLVAEEELHVTIAYSKVPIDWLRIETSLWGSDPEITLPEGGPRIMEAFSDGATVLLFSGKILELRWREVIDAGGSWDWPEYQPHLTISYDPEARPENIRPWTGEIVLGPEIFEEIGPDRKASIGVDE